MTACDDCLRRTDLIAAMAGRLQIEFKRRSAPGRVLALHDEDLLELAAEAEIRRRYAGFDASAARARAAAVGADDDLRRAGTRIPSACATSPTRRRCCTCAATRRCCRPRRRSRSSARGRRRSYGLEVAQTLGRGLSAAGVPVVSGLALGVDSAAHAGALEAPGRHDRRARGQRARRLSRARLAAPRGGRGARRGDLGAAAGSRDPPLVLRRAQPDHRRARRGRRSSCRPPSAPAR